MGLVLISSCKGRAQEITIAVNSASRYSIVVPADATKLEQKAATVLQYYIKRISGASVSIFKDGAAGKAPAIYIGHTSRAEKVHPGKLPSEGYFIHTDGDDLVICAGSGHGIMYGVYGFLEQYMHCSKLSSDPAVVPADHTIKVPGRIHYQYQPPMVYREEYYPASHDAEYLEWNQLQQLDDLWGLWGHSFDKLVPAKEYFKTHPEYYSLVNGSRQPSQLCLSNEDVFRLVVADLKRRMADNPDAMYWSISPNDDNGYCHCDKCSAVDKEQGSPAGSLIKFVNRVAAVFPDKKFTTLAYAYTHKAPTSLKPSANVYVFLSNIDAYRDKPLEQEGTAASFRTDLKAWGGLTRNIFVWDYITQFTNYLAPFPNFHTLQPNMQYMVDNGVKGIFAQGSGDTYGEFAELRSYLEAKLMQDPKADVNALTASFLKDYYGPAAKYIQQYIDLLQNSMLASKRKLDIYGNPVNEWKSYLTPELIDRYSALFDKAEDAVEGSITLQDRVMRARLPLEYTVFQQARFYGIEKHGIFIKTDAGGWQVKPKLESRIATFVADCKKAGVTELSEAGPSRHPDEYLAEWSAIIKAGVTPSKAVGAKVSLQYPFADDYPAKGNGTLTDGNPGYSDFSYNWLCFYGVPMVATVDLGTVQSISRVKMHFLDDPRHWIFFPSKVTVEVSKDGITYQALGSIPAPAGEEHYEVAVKDYIVQKAAQARFIRVTAANLPALPLWRFSDRKKPMIACDEIYVQ